MNLFKYILKRILQVIPLLILVSLISFFIIRLSPVDPLAELRLNPSISQETLSKEMKRLKLDKPIYIQYASWAKSFVQGDLGYTSAGEKVSTKLKERIPNTPIVLHGASTVIPELVEMCNKYGGDIPGAKGVPDEMLHEASISGVSKINVDTDLRLAMTAGIRKVFHDEPNAFDPRKYLAPARDLIKETVKHKMTDVFGSSNKI